MTGSSPSPTPPTVPWVHIVSRLCKGCDFCVQTCPPGVLGLSSDINEHGYHFSFYRGEGCSGCGICFYNCPEPGAVIVWRKPSEKGKTDLRS